MKLGCQLPCSNHTPHVYVICFKGAGSQGKSNGSQDAEQVERYSGMWRLRSWRWKICLKMSVKRPAVKHCLPLHKTNIDSTVQSLNFSLYNVHTRNSSNTWSTADHNIFALIFGVTNCITESLLNACQFSSVNGLLLIKWIMWLLSFDIFLSKPSLN
jgi:hypothetical protein